MLSLKGDTAWQKLRSLISWLLPLPRFDLFLQGTLLILTLYDGFAYLLLKRSAAAGEVSGNVEDLVYIGAGCCELLLAPVLAWWGRRRRPAALAGWLLAAAVSGLLVLGFEQPEVEAAGVRCELLLALVLAWWGRRRRPAALAGWLLAAAVSGLLVLSFEQPEVEAAGVQLCGAPPLPSPPQQPGSSIRGSLVIITVLLCTLARVSVFAHGVTYLDDHHPTNAAYYYGILVSIRVSTLINARSWFAAHAQGPDWWKGQLSLAMLTLMFGVLFLLFPRRMPGWAVEETVEDKSSGRATILLYAYLGLRSTLARLLRSPVFVVQTLGLATLNAGLWGFVFQEEVFARARYHIAEAPGWSDGRTSRLVSNTLRTFVVVFFVAIFRMRFSGRFPDGIKATTASKVAAVLALLTAALFTVIAVLDCETSAVAGLETEYEQPECSQQCECDSGRYGFAPVCDVSTQTTYFSPCHAGCSQAEDLNGFLLLSSCACGGGRAVRGACSLRACATSWALYQILYVNAVALAAASLLMQGLATLRAVRHSDKAAAVGLSLGVVGFVTQAPAHVLYMGISASQCLYSSAPCLLHSQALPAYLAASTAALAALSAGLCVGAWVLRRREAKS
ncbi:solute carrier organic anion transporter family member 2A1 [Plutella xylostella]|uniref:solute carrier organic anion transporter family member 2A1 n=1 Tax=Plutella xylostella TaxID=51655 RepID=UPI002032DCB0|nr:solute carrier organic anion transporter family member 2A1 [Plutella xylostella]